jgi:hypothetical protein
VRFGEVACAECLSWPRRSITGDRAAAEDAAAGAVRNHGANARSCGHWRPFEDLSKNELPRDLHATLNQALTREWQLIRQHSLDGFLPVIEWLRQRCENVPCRQSSLTHGDFHPFNVLIRDHDAMTVIDWTYFRIVDRRLDLANTLMILEAHGSVEYRNAILYWYQHLAGFEVPHLEWFELLPCLYKVRHTTMMLKYGGENIGKHPGATTMVKQNLGGTTRMYELVQKRAGIRIPEFERVMRQNS